MTSSLERMREEWNSIARRNAFWGVLAHPEFEDASNLDPEAFWATGRQDVEATLDRLHLGDTSTWSMVEIGCGLGRMTNGFAQHFAHVYAVDVSPEMIERAKEQWADLQNVDFLLGNGNDLPGLADASVDFVFSYIVLQHVPEPEIVKAYIRETARVLRAGGLAELHVRTDLESFLTTPTRGAHVAEALAHPVRATMRALKYHVRDRFFRRRLPIQHDFGRYDSWKGCALAPAEVERLVQSVGLSIEDVNGLETKYTFYTLRRV